MGSRIGVMQGRLLPPIDGKIQAFPRDRWREEFLLAASMGLEFIEWIFEDPSSNPILIKPGEIMAATADSGVHAPSVCADHFMQQRLNSTEEAERALAEKSLQELIVACRSIGFQRIVLPFVDASSMRDGHGEKFATQALERAIPLLVSEVEIHVESDLAPRAFVKFLDRFDPAHVKVNYDSGNSAALGYSHIEEFEAYGSRVGSVHVKDRVKGGGTVPLGEGEADLPGVFHALSQLGYVGDFVLQVARGVEGQEVGWIKRWRDLVDELRSL